MYLNNWKDGTAEDVFRDFCGERWDNYRNDDDPVPLAEKPAFAGAEILLASYGTPSYEGYAFVLFRRDGKLWEVNGSHCSCYGLEGQWEPEETTVEALRRRVKEGTLGEGGYNENPFAAELLQVLDGLRSGADEIFKAANPVRTNHQMAGATRPANHALCNDDTLTTAAHIRDNART